MLPIEQWATITINNGLQIKHWLQSRREYYAQYMKWTDCSTIFQVKRFWVLYEFGAVWWQMFWGKIEISWIVQEYPLEQRSDKSSSHSLAQSFNHLFVSVKKGTGTNQHIPDQILCNVADLNWHWKDGYQSICHCLSYNLVKPIWHF